DGERLRIELGGRTEVATRGGNLRQAGEGVDVVGERCEGEAILLLGVLEVAGGEVEVAELHAHPCRGLGAGWTGVGSAAHSVNGAVQVAVKLAGVRDAGQRRQVGPKI